MIFKRCDQTCCCSNSSHFWWGKSSVTILFARCCHLLLLLYAIPPTNKNSASLFVFRDNNWRLRHLWAKNILSKLTFLPFLRISTFSWEKKMLLIILRSLFLSYKVEVILDLKLKIVIKMIKMSKLTFLRISTFSWETGCFWWW